MSWTYNASLLNTSSLMQVRLLVGDTNTADQQLQDEEINYFVTQEGSAQAGAVSAARALYAKYSRKATKQVGDLKIDAEKIAQHYLDLLTELQSKSTSVNAIPTAGGIYTSERDANQADESLLHTSIRRGMHDFVKPPVIPNAQ